MKQMANTTVAHHRWRNRVRRTSYLTLLALWAIIALPMCVSDARGASPADVERAISQARNSADDLEYLAAAKILETLDAEKLDGQTKMQVYLLLALYHAEASRMDEEDETKAIDYLVLVLMLNQQAHPPDDFVSRFSDLLDRAGREVQRRKALDNARPQFQKMPRTEVIQEGKEAFLTVRATDADGDSLVLSCRLIPGANFTDLGNGSGRFSYTPKVRALNRRETIWFFAEDAYTDDSAQLILDIRQLLPTTQKAMPRSLLVPGWGQYSTGRKGLGAVFFIGQLVTLGASLALTSSYNGAVDDYETALSAFHSTSSSINNPNTLASAWSNVEQKYEAISDKEGPRNLAYIAAFVVYGANVVDALTSKPRTSEPAVHGQQDPAHRWWRPRVKLGADGLALCLKW